MSEEKYGFIYLWYDRKHKRYYVGSHWGTINDGYICSSNWMKQAIKIRPQDFKRRILKVVSTTRQDLLDEEYRTLTLIKDEELGKRYYNLHKHTAHWSGNPDQHLTVAQKISKKHKGKKKPLRSEEYLRNMSIAQKGKPRSKHSEETKKKMSETRCGKKITHSPEWYEKNRLLGLQRRGKPGYKWSEEEKKMLSAKQKGRPKNPESIAKMKATKTRQRNEKLLLINRLETVNITDK